jgi:aldose 1-epimerase
LKDLDLDDVFSDLDRDAQGRAVVSFKGKTQQLDVVFGPNYKAAVLYSPNPANARGGGGAGGRGGRGGAPPEATPAPKGPAVELTGTKDTVTNRGFLAIEPMAGITSSMNLAQKGLYKELQSVAPGGFWEESFWIRATGFSK